MASKQICIILTALIGFGLSARVNMEDMDYNSLISLLSEYEDGEADESAPVPAAINNVSLESNVPRFQTRPSAPEEEELRGGGGTFDFSITKPSPSNLLAPHVEVFELVEAFLKLKGEMASRIHALINDNFDLIQSVYNVLVRKVAKLHSFTLVGISVVRKIFEFAIKMLGMWEVHVPSVQFGFNKF